ncbi:MAG: M15 family metallopeptidase [Cyanobacteria bacterium P01_A01_bin.3]
MSDFKLDDGIPVALRDGDEPSTVRQKRKTAPTANRPLLPIAIAGTLTLATAAMGGAFLARNGNPGDGGHASAPVSRPEQPGNVASADRPADGAADESSGESSTISGDRDSVLGHFAYAEVDAAQLQDVGQFNGRTERLHAAAAERFREMQAMARQSGLELVAISGFRSTEVQEMLFFQIGQSQSLTPQERALVSAPPGYSEHHTGYAIDIGDGRRPNTHLDVSFETTAAFRWLQANAARYGFELSFPRDNESGVSYEPWHWRFVGNSDSLSTFYSNQSQANSPQQNGGS